jgi:hypothetical protein
MHDNVGNRHTPAEMNPMATKIRFDNPTEYPMAELLRRSGLDRLAKENLRPVADAEGKVGLDELQRLSQVAGLDSDGKLSPAERQRIGEYLEGRKSPVVARLGHSAVDVRSGVRRPVDGYLGLETRRRGDDLALLLDVSIWPSRERPDVEHSVHAREYVFPGIQPNEGEHSSGVRMQRYGEGGHNASVGYEAQGSGAGYIVGIAAKLQGAVLANVSAAGALAKDEPDVRVLFTPAQLARHADVQALARKEGLDPAKLQVEVREVALHSDFVTTEVEDDGARAKDRNRRAVEAPPATEKVPEANLHTLTLDLVLRERDSRKKPREVSMSAYVKGNVTKPLEKLKIGSYDADGRFALGKLEAGVWNTWGFVYPPSFKDRAGQEA